MATRSSKKQSSATTEPSATPSCPGGAACGRAANPTDFGKILYAFCAARHITVGEFAHRVSLSRGFISLVYTGLKLPPLGRIEGWAKALSLSGHERTAFVVLAHLEHATPLIRRGIHQQRQLLMEVSRQGFDLAGLDHEALSIITKYA